MQSLSRFVLVVSLSTPLLGACTGDGEGPEPGTGEVPAGLLDVEGEAEGAYDKALADDVAGVAAVAGTIDSAWRAVRPQVATDGATRADLDAMDAAIADLRSQVGTSTDPVTLARAANAISAPMDELFSLYAPTVPTDILALDYLGREVVLDGKQLDLATATTDVDVIEATWAAVRPAVVAAGGTVEAGNYDASIAALRGDIAAQDGAALVTDANSGLDIVDAIEGVF